MAHALGRDSSQVAWEGREEKSVSREHTFAEDESDRARVRDTLLRLVCEVGLRFRRERRWARTGRIKLRDAAFATVTRQAHFDFPARDDMTFRRLMLSLFDREWPEGVCRTVRLVGFGVTDIVSSPPASDSLFPTPQEADRERRERLSEALDALHASGRGKICYTASGL